MKDIVGGTEDTVMNKKVLDLVQWINGYINKYILLFKPGANINGENLIRRRGRGRRMSL